MQTWDAPVEGKRSEAESASESDVPCTHGKRTPALLREALGSAEAQAPCWDAGLCLALDRPHILTTPCHPFSHTEQYSTAVEVSGETLGIQ